MRLSGMGVYRGVAQSTRSKVKEGMRGSKTEVDGDELLMKL